MDKPQTKEQLEREMLEKATAIEDMVTNHPGWKHLVEAAEAVLERERRSLAGLSIDERYYKKIGFLQMYKYFFAIPGIIKDKKIRSFLLTQGRVLGIQSAQNSPKAFVEWMMKGQEIIRRHFEQSNLQLQEKERAKFHEEQLR